MKVLCWAFRAEAQALLPKQLPPKALDEVEQNCCQCSACSEEWSSCSLKLCVCSSVPSPFSSRAPAQPVELGAWSSRSRDVSPLALRLAMLFLAAGKLETQVIVPG